MKHLIYLIGMLLATTSFGSDLETLERAMTPLGQSPKGSQIVTMNATVKVPLDRGEHLLMYYVDRLSGSSPLPASFEELVADFNERDLEDAGYPLLGEDGQVDERAAQRWINAQLRHVRSINGGLFQWRSILGYALNHEATRVLEEENAVEIHYTARWQVRPVEGEDVVSLPTEDVPADYFDLFHNIAGTEELRQRALSLFAEQMLPRPRLAWQRKLQTVNHLCLGEAPQRRSLTMALFISAFNFMENRCYWPG